MPRAGTLKRHDGRRPGELRPVRITPGFVGKADGSCLMELGGTRVVCTASITPGVPPWRKGSGEGWLTAEYGMLPASTAQRKSRPGLKPDSRGLEIQRLIGRVLRNVVRLDAIGENTVYIDCDVLEADGGTRVASITGAYVALVLAARRAAGLAKSPPAGAPAPRWDRLVRGAVAAVSVGVVAGTCVLDLDYAEDSAADVDMNVAMLANGKFVELGASSERAAFGHEQLARMLALAAAGIRRLLAAQKRALK
jgi:ribonuclease PH